MARVFFQRKNKLFCITFVIFIIAISLFSSSRNWGPASDVKEGLPVTAFDDSRSQVIILSYFRSGSTFVGELLHNYPSTFYHYEPLFMLVGDDTVHSPQQLTNAITIMSDLLECRFDSLVNFTNSYKIHWLKKYFVNNPNSWTPLVDNLTQNTQLDLIAKECPSKDIQIFKLNRLRLSNLRIFLDSYPQLKIVYLTRDPRGLYQSRKNMNFCKSSKHCNDPDFYCADMRQDLDSFRMMKNEYPGRLFSLRYEDLVVDIEHYTKNLLQFLGWDYNSVSNVFDVYIKTHTNAKENEKKKNFYSTMRNDVKSKAFSWKKSLTANETTKVELACSDVIHNLATLNN